MMTALFVMSTPLYDLSMSPMVRAMSAMTTVIIINFFRCFLAHLLLMFDAFTTDYFNLMDLFLIDDSII